MVEADTELFRRVHAAIKRSIANRARDARRLEGLRSENRLMKKQLERLRSAAFSTPHRAPPACARSHRVNDSAEQAD